MFGYVEKTKDVDVKEVKQTLSSINNNRRLHKAAQKMADIGIQGFALFMYEEIPEKIISGRKM